MNGKRALIALILLGGIVSAALTYQKVRGFFTKSNTTFGSDRRPNILVLSFCSLRKERFGFHGQKNLNITPNINAAFARGAFIFDNMMNSMSWTNINDTFWPNISGKFEMDVGYHEVGQLSFGRAIRVPMMREKAFKDTDGTAVFLRDQTSEKHFDDDLKLLSNLIKEKMFQPFFLSIHFKYMHYPLIDRINADSTWDMYLSSQEKDLLKTYFANPEKYHQKLPFLLYLTADPKFAMAHPNVRKIFPKKSKQQEVAILGLVRDESLADEWRRSEGYEQDLAILNKIYDGDLHYLDRQLKGFLNLFDDPELIDNTILIFTGDHGESFMEHGALSHAMSPYQESYAVPFAIRFPGQKRVTHIKPQHTFLTFTEMLKGVMSGDVNKDTFLEEEQKNPENVIVPRDCSLRYRQVRHKNKWSWFTDMATGEQYLFDLQSDPNETKNLVANHPDKAKEMNTFYWKNFETYTYQDPTPCDSNIAGQVEGRRSLKQ